MVMDEKIKKTMRSIATIVERRRSELGYSQIKLAEIAGISRTYVSDVERARRNLSVSTLIRLASALNCDASRLLQEAESTQQEEALN
jgi:transcriptional regulator with XRE-family HTH domain